MRERIINLIEDYVRNYQQKSKAGTEWRKPLVAFARADDPLFAELRNLIAPSHSTPTELLSDARSVISYFLPFESSVIESNVEGKVSARKWAVAYQETNELIADLNQFLKAELAELGNEARTVSATGNFHEDELISEWSHKHVAYVAGLGTFGLHRMLITEEGCAGRLGSIVVDLALEPDERPEEEYCPYRVDGSCGQCVERCVNGSLRENSFDRGACYEVCLSNAEYFSDLGSPEVCGKCAVNVPCTLEKPNG